MDAPPVPESHPGAPPIIDAYEAYWYSLDEPIDATSTGDDTGEPGAVDAYAEYQSLSDA